MKVTKLGHCCMLIEVEGLRILTDPGAWTELKVPDLGKIDIILITHEHMDHLHVDSLKEVLSLSQNATVVTNTSVGMLLDKENIFSEKLEEEQSNSFSGVKIEGFGTSHEEIFGDFGMVQNTGYFINNEFFYPGDAFTNPKKHIPLLALPVAGPWMSIKTALNYARELKPERAFPVHDGMLKHIGPFHLIPKEILGKSDIEFLTPEGDENLVIEV